MMARIKIASFRDRIVITSPNKPPPLTAMLAEKRIRELSDPRPVFVPQLYEQIAFD